MRGERRDRSSRVRMLARWAALACAALAVVAQVAGADVTTPVDVGEPVAVADTVAVYPAAALGSDESAHVADAVAVFPPLAVDDATPVGVADAVGVFPAVAVDDATPVGVADAVGVFPAATVATDEPVHVSDDVSVVPPASVAASEPVHVQDDVAISLAPYVADVEHVGVTDSVSVQILNTPPVARAGGPYTVAEGSTITLSGSASDADGDTLTAAWDLDGDGTFETSGLTPSFRGVEGPASIPVQLRVCDGRGACSFDSATVTVTNVAPAVTITGPATRSAYLVGTAVTFTGSFSDPGVLDTHTAQWSFDALTTPGTVSESNGSGGVLASYTFSKAGVYSVALRVADDDGGIGAASTIGGAEALVAVYDPAAGFVTGSGSFSGPTGTATFALSARYTRSGLAGSFSLVAPAVSFGSTGLEWLVVSGQRAELSGTGTLNGAAGYRFLVIAEDGPVDKIRVEIWGSSPVYDNAPGSSEDLDLAVLRPVAGQIVIHR